jgi:hypothetical protein
MSDESQADAAFMEMMRQGGMLGDNPYTRYNGRIPATTYRGTPTNAMGQPITPPPGMTLNSTPQQQQAAAPPASQWGVNNALISGMQPTLRGAPDAGGRGAYQGYDIGAIVNARAQNDAAYGMTAQRLAGMSPPQAQAAAGGAQGGAAAGGAAGGGMGAAAPDTSYQNALDLLSNPGDIATPGSKVPQAQPLGQPSVLDAFLASQKGGSGAGGYSNQAFFDTLNKLRSA